MKYKIKKPIDKTHGNRWGSRWIRPEKRLAIYVRDAWTCAYCGQQVTRDSVTLDHVHPRRNHGSMNHGADNLVVACRPCNQSKGNHPLSDFLCSLKAFRLRLQIAKRIKARTSRPLDVEHAKALIKQHKAAPRDYAPIV